MGWVSGLEDTVVPLAENEPLHSKYLIASSSSVNFDSVILSNCAGQVCVHLRYVCEWMFVVVILRAYFEMSTEYLVGRKKSRDAC